MMIAWRLFLFSAAAGWVTLWQTGFAWPHEAPSGWSYPLSCCSNYDCREVGDARTPNASMRILERPEGYVVSGTGEVVGYQDRRIRPSPDGAFHWCAHQPGPDAGRTICLFVPPRGF